MRSLIFGLAVTSCAMSLGCATWRRQDAGLDEPFAPRQRVEIWSRGRPITVHGVTVRGDSVRVVPHWYSPTCDSCVLYYSRATIDSVRVRVPAPDRTVVLATLIGAITVFGWDLATSGPWFQ